MRPVQPSPTLWPYRAWIQPVSRSAVVLVDYSLNKRIFLVAVAVFQNFAAGGILYGW
jgi:hypothetical protein